MNANYIIKFLKFPELELSNQNFLKVGKFLMNNFHF